MVTKCECLDCIKAESFGKQMANRRGIIADNLEDDFATTFPNVEWNTEPILGNVLTVWKDYWDGKTWILWHQKVKQKYGQKRANEVLIEWFHRSPFASPTLDLRTFDDAFIAYAKENGFYDALFSGLLPTVLKTGAKVTDTATKAIDAAGDILDFDVIKWVIIGIVVLVVGAIVYKIVS